MTDEQVLNFVRDNLTHINRAFRVIEFEYDGDNYEESYFSADPTDGIHVAIRRIEQMTAEKSPL